MGYFSDVYGFGSPLYYSTMQFVDGNGDGRTDICARSATGPYCYFFDGKRSFRMGTERNVAEVFTQGWSEDRSNWGTVQFPDLDGDGRADVCGRSPAGTVCARSRGSSFTGYLGAPAAAFSDAAGFARSPSYWATLQFPDLNGDGKADHCGRGERGVLCALGDGNGFGLAGRWDRGALSDRNGFGRSGTWQTLQFPDVDGDGKADLCARGPAGVVCGRSDGKRRFAPMALWSRAFADGASSTAWGNDPHHYGTIHFPDLDGDGRQDICGRATGGVLCGLSTGAAFADVHLWTPDYGDAAGWSDWRYALSIQFGDLDADGDQDVCGRFKDHVLCALSDGRGAFQGARRHDAFPDDDGWSRPGSALTFAMPVLLPGTCARPGRRPPTPIRSAAARFPF